MATREENLKKINAEFEKMSDEELDQVVGGFMKAYFFIYTKVNDNCYIYTKDPITCGIATEPIDFIKDNINFFAVAENQSLIEISDSNPSGKFQKFADDNASRWSSPSTWGNLVFAVDPIRGTFTRYES